jgi:hypothetical protein
LAGGPNDRLLFICPRTRSGDSSSQVSQFSYLSLPSAHISLRNLIDVACEFLRIPRGAQCGCVFLFLIKLFLKWVVASRVAVARGARDQVQNRRFIMSECGYLRRRALVDALVNSGRYISPGTMNKLCAPAIGLGPPVAGYFGARPLYTLDEGIAWYDKRVRQEPTRLIPAE